MKSDTGYNVSHWWDLVFVVSFISFFFLNVKCILCGNNVRAYHVNAQTLIEIEIIREVYSMLSSIINV